MIKLENVIVGNCFYYICDWLINKPEYSDLKKQCGSIKDKHLIVLGNMNFSLLKSDVESFFLENGFSFKIKNNETEIYYKGETFKCWTYSSNEIVFKKCSILYNVDDFQEFKKEALEHIRLRKSIDSNLYDYLISNDINKILESERIDILIDNYNTLMKVW